ncbi:MAG: enoyl-CoA hydratase [Dehalococcoidia bacterium]
MEYERLVVQKEGHIATVTLNRPKVGNAFDFGAMEEIDHVFRDNLDKDSDVRAVILTGAGDYFCTGLDLTMFASSEPQVDVASARVQDETEQVPWGKGSIVGAVAVMKSMGKPVIAAVNGPAVGLGCSLALACDIRIASDRARFGMMFVKRGLAPDTGGSFTLPRIVGFAKATELLLTGDTIDASEAQRIGMVSTVVPHDELMTCARELVQKIAKYPPLAVAITKEALNRSVAETDIVEQMKREVEYQDKMLNTEDFKEAAAAFLEKREPVFKGK